jgi:hypothetical protein
MFALVLLLACGVPLRVEKSLVSPTFVVPAAPAGQAAVVSYSTGIPGEPVRDYTPELVANQGRLFHQATELSTGGWVEVAPLWEPVELRVYVRNTTGPHQDFQLIRSVTGGLAGELPNEIRFLPERVDSPYRLPIRQLTNVYNEYKFRHGDLLLIELHREGHQTERYLFQDYEAGLRIKYSGGFLLTVPLAFAGGKMPETTSPILAFTTSFGWRLRTRSPVLRWFGGNSAFIVSTGVGSTALKAPSLTDPLEDQVTAHVTSIISGGGFEFYDFFSIQALVNLSALGGDIAQAPWVMAIGFDPVRFGLFMESLGTRLFWNNELDRRKEG